MLQNPHKCAGGPTAKNCPAQDVAVLRLRTPGLPGRFRRAQAQGRPCTALGGPENVALTLLEKVASLGLTPNHQPVSDLCSACSCTLGTGPCPGRSPCALHPSSLTAVPGVPRPNGTVHARGLHSLALPSPEAKPPSHSPHFQFYIHTLKTFGKSESSLAICLFPFYYIYNKKKNQKEIESKLQILSCLPGSWAPRTRLLLWVQKERGHRSCSRQVSCTAHDSLGCGDHCPHR